MRDHFSVDRANPESVFLKGKNMKIRITKSDIPKFIGMEIDIKDLKGFVVRDSDYNSEIFWINDSSKQCEIIIEQKEESKPLLTQCIERMKEIIG